MTKIIFVNEPPYDRICGTCKHYFPLAAGCGDCRRLLPEIVEDNRDWSLCAHIGPLPKGPRKVERYPLVKFFNLCEDYEKKPEISCRKCEHYFPLTSFFGDCRRLPPEIVTEKVDLEFCAYIGKKAPAETERTVEKWPRVNVVLCCEHYKEKSS